MKPILALALLAATLAHAQTPDRNGTFTLFKFAKPTGRENFTLTASRDHLDLHDSFLFTDRGTRVPLDTSFRAAPGLTPQRLLTAGRTSRVSTLDDQLETHGTTVRLKRSGRTTTLPLPPNAFLIDGYAPVAMQQLLLRFWLTHGRPATVSILPSGSRVTIHPAGTLLVRNTTLTAYTVRGLIWGQEALWLDPAGNLVALIGTDAELDHFEAIRAGYEQALPQFSAAAVSEELADLAPAHPPSTQLLAITGATLLDGLDGPPIPNAVVLIANGRIQKVGPARTTPIPPEATLLDARGKYLLPGLWDMHAHLEQVEWGPIYLASGITTVRDCGNELPFLLALRDALAAGRAPGPRILFAGLVDGPGPISLGAVTASTPDEARAVVARYHAAGASQIKLYSSIAPALVPVFTAEAHRLGMTVTGHVPTGMSTAEAVLAGMDQINHIQYPAADFLAANHLARGAPIPFDSAPSRDLLALFRAHRTVFDPTLAIYELQLHPTTEPVSTFEPGITHVAPALRQPLESTGVSKQDATFAAALLQNDLRTVAALHRAGLPIVAGTDQLVPGSSLHRELELYVQAGLSPAEALATATRIPAEVMGLAADTGTVEPGKRADLLLLNADPLADIRNTRSVWRTVAAGVVYDPAPLWQSVDFTP